MHPVITQAVALAQPGWLGAWAACAAVALGRAETPPEALQHIDGALCTNLSLSLCPAYSGLGAALAADPGLLGDAFAAAAAPETNRRKGRFYTPASVVSAVIPAQFQPGDIVLDPACGGGRFLLGALQRHPDGAAGLWGIDLDPIAAAVSRAAIWLASGQRARIEVGDPLAGHADQGPLKLPPHSAHHVVGNPPYRAARRGQSLTGAPAAYRRAFNTAEYQLDPYLLFLELGLHALKPGGTLRMIVPNAWASNLRAGRLRRLLTHTHGLRSLVELPEATFAAGVETVAVEVRHSGDTPSHIPVRALDGQPRGTLVYDAARPEAALPLARTPQTLALLQASRRWTSTLGDVAEITRGINPYHHSTHTPEQISARVHHADHPRTPEWRPEQHGRDLVGPYRLWPAGQHYIHYGPWLKEPRQPRFFEGPRLLVRKVLGRTLCAAYVEAPGICDQSLYIARLSSTWPAGALLACVNSQLMATLFRARHQEHDRLFPQIKVRELRELPLPPIDPSHPDVHAVAEAALALQALEDTHALRLRQTTDDRTTRRRLLRAGWPPEPDARAQLEIQRQALDDAVARLYGVDPHQLQEPPC
jgi:SAM-dependent methyltransferase